LKEKVYILDSRIEKLEKYLESFVKSFHFLKNHFIECQYSLTIIMEDWDKRKVHLVQLGEKVIQLDNFQVERFTQIMAHFHQELA